jgi:AraC family transcriptional regulator, ethanolamine operon transcriptional activator
VTRIVFLDFDEFADAVESMIGQFMPIARSSEEWWVQSVATGRVLTQTFQIGGPATFAGDGKRDQIALQIPLTDATKIRIDGRFLEQDSFLLIKEGQPFTLSTSEATQWAAILVPTDHEFLNPEFMTPQMSRLFYNKTTARVDATAEHLNRIRFLVARLSAVAHSIALDATTVRCAEEEIIVAVSRALEASSKAPTRQIGRPSFSRARIIARILALLQASTGEPLFTGDLCRATGVAERTLRNIFHEYFGVGPMRLLKVRQLREIHAALLVADPAHETVTRIAARFGVWDFSLFARNYKVLFGQSPSSTLRRASKRALHHFTARDTWLQYATRAFSSKAGGVVCD